MYVLRVALTPHRRRILSYEGRGVPREFARHEHSIVYTGKRPPEPTTWELPTRENLTSLKLPVRIKRRDRATALAQLSRIRYSTLYRVNHDVMACAFGEVDGRFNWTLKQQVKAHFQNMKPGAHLPPNPPKAHKAEQHRERISQALSSSDSSDDGVISNDEGPITADSNVLNSEVSATSIR